MSNKFRLTSEGMFKRQEEDNQEMPRRIVFLSVEGNCTERQYFNYVEQYRSEIGIKKAVHIHPLERAKNDTLSAPTEVLELLEECIELRRAEDLPKCLQEAIPKDYSVDFVRKYIHGELEEKIEYAIAQAKKRGVLAIDDLIGKEGSATESMGKIGTNIPELFDLLRKA